MHTACREHVWRGTFLLYAERVRDLDADGEGDKDGGEE